MVIDEIPNIVINIIMLMVEPMVASGVTIVLNINIETIIPEKI